MNAQKHNNLLNHLTFHSEERLVTFIRSIDSIIGLSSYKFIVSMVQFMKSMAVMYPWHAGIVESVRFLWYQNLCEKAKLTNS